MIIMHLAIQVILQMFLIQILLASAYKIKSEYTVLKEMSASTGMKMKQNAKSRTSCAALIGENTNCTVASFDRKQNECILHYGDTTHSNNPNWDIVWRKGQCKENWVQFTGSCYFFTGDKMSWRNAMDDCKREGANLVKINDAVESTWLLEMVKEFTSIEGIWIGANDRAMEGQWIWSSDDSKLNYTNWDANEPNNDPWPDGEENCGSLRVAKNRWNDLSCLIPSYYICEN